MLCELNPQLDATTVPLPPSVIDVKEPTRGRACVPLWFQKWVLSTAAVIGALICIVFIEGLIFAATPRSGRFLDRLLRSNEPPPQLISVPVPRPPTVAEKQAVKRKLTGVPTTESKKPSAAKVEYDWESFVRFAEAFHAVGEHVLVLLLTQRMAQMSSRSTSQF